MGAAKADPFDLARFEAAQAPVYARVVEELRRGRKTSHWMWFVFPQLRGLGHSNMAFRYGLTGREEAAAYLAHPVLGGRLREGCALLLEGAASDIHVILGSPDDLKFQSCLTLFDAVAPEETVFADALARFYRGERDAQTLTLLAAS